MKTVTVRGVSRDDALEMQQALIACINEFNAKKKRPSIVVPSGSISEQAAAMIPAATQVFTISIEV